MQTTHRRRLTRSLFTLLPLAALATCSSPPFSAVAPQRTPAAALAAGQLPEGYRDWRLISLAHEEGTLHSFAAVLGNDIAINAFRHNTLPFPDGTIIASLHYQHLPNDNNNQVFGQPQSFTPGPPTNIQFMLKDSTKYASTGGWNFSHFENGKPTSDPAKLQSCLDCHQKPQAHDLIFTHYAP